MSGAYCASAVTEETPKRILLPTRAPEGVSRVVRSRRDHGTPLGPRRDAAGVSIIASAGIGARSSSCLETRVLRNTGRRTPHAHTPAACTAQHTARGRAHPRPAPEQQPEHGLAVGSRAGWLAARALAGWLGLARWRCAQAGGRAASLLAGALAGVLAAHALAHDMLLMLLCYAVGAVHAVSTPPARGVCARRPAKA